MQAKQLCFRYCNWLNEEDSAFFDQAAELIFAASAEYFAIFSQDKATLKKAIYKLMTTPGSEYADCFIAVDDQFLVAIYTAFPASESFQRKMLSLQVLLPLAVSKAETMVKLREYRQQLPLPPSDSFYGSVIAVNPNYRSSGIGQLMTQHFEAETRAKGFSKLAFHVHTENVMAQKLYKKIGCEIFSYETSAEYIVMGKILKAS